MGSPSAETAAAPSQSQHAAVWNTGLFTSVALIAVLYLLPAASVVSSVRGLLFAYFVLCSLDVVLTKYHLRNFEPLAPHLGRFALVTGATSGIGKEMAYMLAEKKYSLLITARTLPILERMRAEIEVVHEPVKVEICDCDLSTREGIQKLIDFVKEKELVIDILINNAGASMTKDFTAATAQEVEQILTLDVVAVTKIMHAILPQMTKRGIGRVLNIASMAANMSIPTAALYSSSKAFVLNISQAINYELRGTGVTLTSFCPGPVDTNFGSAADCDKAIYMNLPGMNAHVKDTARLALDAMFNGRNCAHDTYFSSLSMWAFRTFVPARLGMMNNAVSMHTPDQIWQHVKA